MKARLLIYETAHYASSIPYIYTYRLGEYLYQKRGITRTNAFHSFFRSVSPVISREKRTDIYIRTILYNSILLLILISISSLLSAIAIYRLFDFDFQRFIEQFRLNFDKLISYCFLSIFSVLVNNKSITHVI